MRFWDTPAIVPLLLGEPTTRLTLQVLAEDPDQCVWWGTTVECASALARDECEGGDVEEAFERLDGFARAWREVEPTNAVKRTATRLLRTHSLRPADALQLSAAIQAAEGAPRSLPFVTADAKLAEVAAREGFPVVRPGHPPGAR